MFAFYLPARGPVQGKAGGVSRGAGGTTKGWLRIDAIDMEFLNRRPEFDRGGYIVAGGKEGPNDAR